MAGCKGLLQGNLNHSRRAQDLFLHTLAGVVEGVGVVAEPYRVLPDHPDWVGDAVGSVAIVRSPSLALPFARSGALGSGEGWVAVEWGSTDLVAVYAPPRWSRARFELLLEEVGALVRRRAPSALLLAGDFNAKSTLWGSQRENARGATLAEWAAELDLVILNTGSRSTCVRWAGESIVDLTWATPTAARLVAEWRVSDEETLSDHKYIVVGVQLTPHERLTRGLRASSRPRRWSLGKLDEDLLMAAVLTSAWAVDQAELEDPVEGAKWLSRTLAGACDAAMPRSRPCPRRTAYWWTEEIAELRRSSVRARRAYTRSRRRRDLQRTALAYRDYRAARLVLCEAIRREKVRAWDSLVKSLDEDPWGRPYRIVLGKHRPRAPPATESLPPDVLEAIVGTLFPTRLRVDCTDGEEGQPTWAEPQDVVISEREMARAARRLGGWSKAPGPDGVPGRVVALTFGVMKESLRRLFTSCLREGRFPPVWKKARLVLLPKPGKPEGLPASYRPICLLDEVGKLFERVIARRLVQHLGGNGPDLSDSQFGFREARSTVDAISRVKALTQSAVAEGGVVLAVALDISNAFNTLPWDSVEAGLSFFRVPPYLRAVLRDYFRDRSLEFADQRGLQRSREVYCGVPQGSVLGPILWNIAYDVVLRASLPPGGAVVCYADDTIVLATGKDWGEATATADEAVACVVRSIRAVGLEVAPHKTEAVFFHDGARGEPPQTQVNIGAVRIQVGLSIKYLGLHLDGRWRLRGHFGLIEPKASRMAASLGRLLPNLGGPSQGVRRLYANTVLSVALYGAPVWAREFDGDRRIQSSMRRPVRLMAIRLARAYRTVSFTAVTVLAGLPPLSLVALSRADFYRRVCRLREIRGPEVPARAVNILRRHARQSLVDGWVYQLAAAQLYSYGQRTVDAIRPVLQQWLDRGWGGLSYRLTQVLTGHGCFGEYLALIGRERTKACHHCVADRDTAQHTLEFCPAWAEERGVLVAVVGEDLSLPALIRAMLGSERGWRAASLFCEVVISQKEEAERVRRGETAPPGLDAEARARWRPRRRLRPPRPAHLGGV